MNRPIVRRPWGRLNEHELYPMFYEEALRITRDQQAARGIAEEALRDFLERHRPVTTNGVKR